MGYCNSKKQRSNFNCGDKTLNLIAKTYLELSLNENDTSVGEYLITKIVTSNDIVGADYVALKAINKNDEIANLIIGDIIGHGIDRSPGAIITMSVFHGMKSTDVLHIQKDINRVLLGINKELGGKTYCLSLLLKKNGLIECAGKAESIILIRNKKHFNLKPHGEILGISEHLKYTKKSFIHLNYGDVLMIQTDGAVFENEDDDKTIVMITRINYKV